MSSIQVAMSGMGYLPANQRPACKNCRNAEQRGDGLGGYRWYCSKGGFYTTALAICDKNLPKNSGGSAK